MPQKAENVRNMPAKYQINICYSTEIPWFQSSVLPPIPRIKKKCQFFRRFSIVRRWALNTSHGAKTAVRIENTPIFCRFRGQISKKNIPTSSKWISNAISKSGPTRPAGGHTGPAVRERVKLATAQWKYNMIQCLLWQPQQLIFHWYYVKENFLKGRVWQTDIWQNFKTDTPRCINTGLKVCAYIY